MKKKLLLFICITLSIQAIFSQNVSMISNTSQQITLQFHSGQLQVSDIHVSGDSAIFSRVKMDGYLSSREVGMPELPVYVQMIEIPLCGEMHINVTTRGSHVYDAWQLGIYNQVYPAQPDYNKSYIREHHFVKNYEVYETDEFYRDDLVRVEKNGVMRCVNLATVYVFPVQYNPVSEQIRIVDDITVTITYDDVDMEATHRMKRLHGSAQFNAPDAVINPIETERDELTHAPIKYVIVANSMFEGQLDTLANWKRRMGYIVDIAYTDDIGNTTTSIKNYLKGLYDNATAENPAPTFVLLVGDQAQIPAYNSQTNSNHITDLYYFTWTDNDNIPDCYYGRFSAQNSSQLTPQIDKTLLYEQYLMPDPSYLDEAVLVAGEDNGDNGDFGYSHANPTMHYAEDNYINSTYGYTGVHAYYNPHNSNTSDRIRNYLNAGVGFANYSAHCSASGWGRPTFNTGHISSMNNADKYGVMIGNCCQSNMFNQDECFGEALLRTANKGAVAYIGGTDFTYWDEDYYWAVGLRNLQSNCTNCNNATYDTSRRGMYDRLFHTHNESYSDRNVSTGAMIMAGNMAVQASSSNLKQYYWEIYSLMGDPSLMCWLTQPDDMTITINGSATTDNTFITMEGTTDFTISTGVPYAYIALTNNLNLISAVMADADGNATLTFPALAIGETYELAISAQNYKTLFTTIIIEASNTPYIIMQDYTPQILVHGETTRLTLTMKNIGGVATTDSTTVILNCNDSLLVLNDAIASYGIMTDHGGTAIVNDGFQVTADNDVESGHLFTIYYTATHDGDSWNGSFTLRAIGSDCDAPTGLTAAVDDNNNVVLTWPGNSSQQTINITDDVEGHPGFAINSPGDVGWDYIDGDSANTFNYNTINFPNEGSAMAYIVMDMTQTTATSNGTLIDAYSGNKFFGCPIACYTETWYGDIALPNDDWIISPELNFTLPYTFSFYARSYSDYYSNDQFYVAYSTTGKEVGNFININNITTTTGEWTEYSYTIPANAKYVAIHCLSNDQYMFCVDNIAITGQITNGRAYNIYRNGILIDSNLYANTYTDTGLAEGDYCYTISSYCTGDMETAQSEESCITIDNGTPTYTITVRPDNAAHGNVDGGGVYQAGDTVTLTATPAEHYTFNRWNDNSTDNPHTITVTGSATYIAYFNAEQYTITAEADDAGHGSVTGGGTYSYGTTVTLTATPAEHYAFSRWDDNNTDNPRIITVTDHARYIAHFVTTGSGISENNKASISIYPNPATHFICIKLDNSASAHAAIYDVYGKKIADFNLKENVNNLDIGSCADGLYFIRISDDQQIISTFKFIKK